MQELIQQLQEKAGLTAEQAAQSIGVIKEYVKAKLPPFIAGTVDNWFAGLSNKPEEKKANLIDQTSDFLDNVRDKAEDWAEEAQNKITDFFHKHKKEA